MEQKDNELLTRIYKRLARLGQELDQKEKARRELGGSTGQKERDTENYVASS